MITEWFVWIAEQFVGWLAEMFGEWTPPPEMASAATTINALLEGMAGFGVWVDFGVLATCVGIAVGVWTTVIIIKLARAIAAHVPLFGGAGD